MLTKVNSIKLGEVEIKRVIFQGDALSPLVFVSIKFAFKKGEGSI